jgi:hypothetical protein
MPTIPDSNIINRPNNAEQFPYMDILALLKILFNASFLCAINIVISGHLLGYVFNLSNQGRDFFRVRIPWLHDMGITGRRVIAGFTALTISIFVVGFFFHKLAKEMFINNMGATDDKWLACLYFSTGFSVTICLLLSSIRLATFSLNKHKYDKENYSDTDEKDRLDKLLK